MNFLNPINYFCTKLALYIGFAAFVLNLTAIISKSFSLSIDNFLGMYAFDATLVSFLFLFLSFFEFIIRFLLKKPAEKIRTALKNKKHKKIYYVFFTLLFLNSLFFTCSSVLFLIKD